VTRPPRTRWDERYRSGDWLDDPSPSAIVEDAGPWLETSGRALDLACGAGRNALYLAERGYSVVGVDISVQGLRILRDRARSHGLPVQPILAELPHFHVRPESFQVVVNTHFLLRESFDLIRRALSTGGIVLFETFHVDEIDRLGGDIRRAYALEEGELKRAFADFELLRYEEGVFERPEGDRGLTRMIARKPAP